MCPGCDSAMQRFFAAGVEIDRCQFCGGYWLDGGELEQVLGHAIEFDDLGGFTQRRCVSCTVTLHPVTVHGVPVELCDLCHSVYLDEGELTELAQEEVKLSPAGVDAPPQRETVTFQCAGCGSVKELSDSYSTAGGLACSLCASMLDATPSALPDTRIGFGTGRTVLGFGPYAQGVDLAGLISSAFRLFR